MYWRTEDLWEMVCKGDEGEMYKREGVGGCKRDPGEMCKEGNIIIIIIKGLQSVSAFEDVVGDLAHICTRRLLVVVLSTGFSK